MEYSNYNVVKSDYGFTFIFNTFSGNLLKIPTNQWENVDENPELLDSLRKAGIIVTSNNEEVFKYKYLCNRASFDSQSLSITIAPTMNCNFDCFYCFEGDNKSDSKMSEDVEDAIVTFIEKRASYPHINWFGGEPLMGFKNIVSITHKLQSKNIKFGASMITNGSLLTQDKINSLEGLNISRIQISIDGIMDVHDSRRFFKGGGKSFDIIIKNIRNLLTNTSIQAIVQITIDKSNINAYHDALHYFNCNFREYVGKQLYVGYNLVQNRTNFDKESVCFNHDDELKYRESIDLLDEKNKEMRMPGLKSLPCMYRRDDSFAIDNNGFVYKCLEHLGNKDYAIGNLVNKKTSLTKVANCFYQEDPFQDLKCVNCNVFPICGGGCPLDRIRSKGAESKSYCSFYKTKLAEMLPYYYENKDK